MSVFDRLLPRRQEARNAPDPGFLELRSSFHNAIDELFRQFASEPFGVRSLDELTGGFSPRVDVTEDEHNVYVAAELPGLSPGDVELALERDALVLRGEKKHEKESEEHGWHRSERSWGSFMRRISLPVEIREDDVKASFKDGVLHVTLPRAESAKRHSRSIPVHSG